MVHKTNNITIRQAVDSDYPTIFNLNQEAFKQLGEARLVEALRNNPAVFVPRLSLVATYEPEILGHILFSQIQIIQDDGVIESLSLAPMAVKPEHQNKGIGGQLIVSGLEIATLLGFKSVIVLGHEHYYPKFGFHPAERWHIYPPFDVPSKAFMAIELIEAGLANCAGTVSYPKEFESV